MWQSCGRAWIWTAWWVPRLNRRWHQLAKTESHGEAFGNDFGVLVGIRINSIPALKRVQGFDQVVVIEVQKVHGKMNLKI